MRRNKANQKKKKNKITHVSGPHMNVAYMPFITHTHNVIKYGEYDFIIHLPAPACIFSTINTHTYVVCVCVCALCVYVPSHSNVSTNIKYIVCDG